jgi:acetolactate synthase-1/2/3 large subunit
LRVTDPAQLDDALAQCLASKGPFFLDVCVAEQENCFPMMPAGAGHHRMMLAEGVWYEDDAAAL